MRRLSFVIVSVLLLAGCSSGGSSDGPDEAEQSPGSAVATDTPGASGSPAATSKVPTGPPCSSVWQEGKTLPADYEGCLDGDTPGEADVIDCSDGSQLITYADEFFARSGQEIMKPVDAPIQDTEDYSAAFSDCTGE